MARTIEHGMKAAIFSALFPAKYQAWYFPDEHAEEKGPRRTFIAARSTWWPRPDLGGRTYTPAYFTAGVAHCPFKKAAATGQLWWPVVREYGPSKYDGDRNQSLVAAFGKFVPKEFWWTLPTAALTDEMFKPPQAGGIGLDPEAFWRRAYLGGSGKSYPFTSSGVGQVSSEAAAHSYEWISDEHVLRAPSCTE